MSGKNESVSGAIATVVVGILAIPTAIVVLVILGPVIGWFAGWVVGLLFSDMFHRVMQAFGAPAVPLADLGAFLGFVSAFFRTAQRK